MSRSAHAQSKYKLRQFPRCSRCKQQFILVTARYQMKNGETYTIDEWECTKCNKYVPKKHLKEEPISEDEAFFHRKAIEIQNERETEQRKDCRNSLQRDIQNTDSE